jgi:hypothetical protein
MAPFSARRSGGQETGGTGISLALALGICVSPRAWAMGFRLLPRWNTVVEGAAPKLRGGVAWPHGFG